MSTSKQPQDIPPINFYLKSKTQNPSSKTSTLTSRNQSLNKHSKTNKLIKSTNNSNPKQSRSKPRETLKKQPSLHLLSKIKKFRIHTLTKYNPTPSTYNTKIINDIIHDERKHIVCLFKNFLFWDETSDFLKRFYFLFESVNRLPQITDYYETYTLFPPVYFAFEDIIKILNKNTKRKKKYLEMIEENEDKVYNELKNGNNKNKSKDKNIKYIISPSEIKEISSLKSYKNENDNEHNVCESVGNENKSLYSNYAKEFNVLMNYNFKQKQSNNSNNNNYSESILNTLVNDNNNCLKESKTLFDISNGGISCINNSHSNNDYMLSNSQLLDVNDLKMKSIINNKKCNNNNNKVIEIKKLDLQNINSISQKSNANSKQKDNKNNVNPLKLYTIPVDTKSHTQRENSKLTSLSKITNNLNNNKQKTQLKKKSLITNIPNQNQQQKYQTIDNLIHIIHKQPTYTSNNYYNSNSSNSNSHTNNKTKNKSKEQQQPQQLTKKATSSKIQNNLVIQTKQFTKKNNIVYYHNNDGNNIKDNSLRISSKKNPLRKMNNSNNNSSTSISKTKQPNKITMTSPSNIMSNNVVMPSSVYNINLNVNLEQNPPFGNTLYANNYNSNPCSSRKPQSITTSLNKKKTHKLLQCVKNLNNPSTRTFPYQDNSNNIHKQNLSLNNNKQNQKSTKSLNSKLKENKVSYDLNVNNVYISIHKQTASTSQNQMCNNISGNENVPHNTSNQNKNLKQQHNVNININCGTTAVNHSSPNEKKVSRNENKSITTQSKSNKTKQCNQNNTLSIYNNKTKNMVIPFVNNGCKNTKITKKGKLKEAQGVGDGSVSLIKINKKLANDKGERKYPLTSRNEKERIPYELINKIIKKSK